MDESLDYDKACKDAATRQGLDPVLAAFKEADVPCTLEQTGGFTMVVTVSCPEGTFAVIDDGGYLLGMYPHTTWQDGTLDEPTHVTLPLPQIVEHIAGHLRGGPFFLRRVQVTIDAVVPGEWTANDIGSVVADALTQITEPETTVDGERVSLSPPLSVDMQIRADGHLI